MFINTYSKKDLKKILSHIYNADIKYLGKTNDHEIVCKLQNGRSICTSKELVEKKIKNKLKKYIVEECRNIGNRDYLYTRVSDNNRNTLYETNLYKSKDRFYALCDAYMYARVIES